MHDSNKNYKLKKEVNDIQLSTSDEIKVLCVAMAQQASRSIDIISPSLDNRIFDNADFVEAVRQLAISSQFTSINILIKDIEPIIKYGHRIIPLAQQLTSSIQVRGIAEEYLSYNEAFMLIDTRAIIYQPNASRYEGIANFNRPNLARELKNYFVEVWERSTPEQNMRRLHI